jgi:hypothetical protein
VALAAYQADNPPGMILVKGICDSLRTDLPSAPDSLVVLFRTLHVFGRIGVSCTGLVRWAWKSLAAFSPCSPL